MGVDKGRAIMEDSYPKPRVEPIDNWQSIKRLKKIVVLYDTRMQTIPPYQHFVRLELQNQD